MIPNRKSFQIEVNCQIATTMKPGSDSGNTMWRYSPKKPAPSMRPASSISPGTVA